MNCILSVLGGGEECMLIQSRKTSECYVSKGVKYMTHKYSTCKILQGLHIALHKAWTLWYGIQGSCSAWSLSFSCPNHLELLESPCRLPWPCHSFSVAHSRFLPLLLLIPPHLSKPNHGEALPMPLAPTLIWMSCHTYVFPRHPGFIFITVGLYALVSPTRLASEFYSLS